MTTEPRLKYVTYLYEIVDEAKWRATNPFNSPDQNGLHVLGVSCGDLMEVTHKIEEIVNSVKSDEDKIAHIKTVLSERFP